ncbi:TetR family transcriptional regulator [Nocardioides albertanoniae]|uniref:TetR family transcriptional regulator n=1 Tax=Nocardioides albertanoniae TaxID=1175486 RepID=A0A543A149_9ACTN|nr:TetR/AcrR family transcriptional regulator [Nocardioides albertanoniae]TQL66317.1 TetR family transcriptional regulator [Nocardioides albertanoniae]
MTPRNSTSGKTTGKQQRVIRGLDADQRREQRRQALLDAALELFAAQGFVNTSIEQLCQHAYVATKSFYESFDGRDDLYGTLLQQITDRAFARLASVVDEAPDEETSTRLLLAELAHTFVDDVRIAQVTFGQGSAITPAAERQRRENRRAAAAFVEDLWVGYGTVLTERYHGIVIGLIGGLFDIIADWVLDVPAAGPTPAMVEELITRLSDFYDAVRNGS